MQQSAAYVQVQAAVIHIYSSCSEQCRIAERNRRQDHLCEYIFLNNPEAGLPETYVCQLV